MELLQRWCSRAQRSRIPDFVRCARTIRTHQRGIAAAVNRGLANGRPEGLNNKVRTMTRRSYGFHSPEAALALIMLACGPIKLELPTTPEPTHIHVRRAPYCDDRQSRTIRYRTATIGFPVPISIRHAAPNDYAADSRP